MSAALVDSYGDLLRALEPERQTHSIAVGRKVESAASLVPAPLRSDLAAAGVLHDIGYAHPSTGFHPLDGARFLAALGFSGPVCNLVVHHSASTWEAEERGFDLSVYAEFALNGVDLGPAHAVLWWADLTTGPKGEDVAVEERLEEIRTRYGPSDVVTRFISRAQQVLLVAGQSPIGSIQVPC